MYIFAWILFVLYIISFGVRCSMLLGKCMSINTYGPKVDADMHWWRTAVDIAAFVFICIYLFAR